MNGWGLRLTGAGLLMLLGMAVGTWATTSHFRPLLDDQQDRVSVCSSARDNLAGLAQEQGRALGELQLAAQARAEASARAVDEAKPAAQVEYAAANRLQQERTGGDQCAAATSIIDKDLGL